METAQNWCLNIPCVYSLRGKMYTFRMKIITNRMQEHQTRQRNRIQNIKDVKKMRIHTDENQRIEYMYFPLFFFFLLFFSSEAWVLVACRSRKPHCVYKHFWYRNAIPLSLIYSCLFFPYSFVSLRYFWLFLSIYFYLSYYIFYIFETGDGG